MNDTLQRAVAAHGGLEYWRSLERLEVEMSASGLLFVFKRIAPIYHGRLSVSTDKPEVVLLDYPQRGRSAHFSGEGATLRNADGAILARRERCRPAFREWGRLLSWDALDFAYFCGYAMWNYLTMPFLLLADGVEVREERGNALTAQFPPGLPTHCPTQRFRFDATGHLLRHDYTAEVVGGWATAAHFSGEYRQFGGLNLPTRRRVYPKLLGVVLPFITLVAIDIHQVRPMPRKAAE